MPIQEKNGRFLKKQKYRWADVSDNKEPAARVVVAVQAFRDQVKKISEGETVYSPRLFAFGREL
jgi:hypothetical protein